MEETKPFKYKWLFTVLIFNVEEFVEEIVTGTIPERISLEFEKNFILDSIENANYDTGRTKVIIVETNLKRSTNSNGKLETIFKEKGNDNKISEGVIEKMSSDKEMLDKNSLIEILKKIKNEFIGENNIVLTLGHGGTFGINYIDEEILMKMVIEGLKEDSPYFEMLKKSLSSLNFIHANILQHFPNSDLSSGFYLLSSKEIADAFKQVYTKSDIAKPIDIMLMSNCFVQNIFTQFDLHEVVDYFIAPISGISYPGFNIKEILEMLDTQASCQEVSKFCIDGKVIRNNQYNDPFVEKAIEERWFIQNVKLDSKLYLELEKGIIKLLEEIYNLLMDKENYDIIRNYIDSLTKDNYKYSKKTSSSLDLVDFGVFCKTFWISLKLYNKGIQFNDTNLLSHLDFIVDILDKISNGMNHFIGNDFLEDEIDFNDYKIRGIEKIGFGFYFPLDYEEKSQLGRVLSHSNVYLPEIIKDTRFLEIIRLLKSEVL